MPKTFRFLKEDIEAIYAYSGANGYQRDMNSDEEEEGRTVYVEIYADDGPKAKKKKGPEKTGPLETKMTSNGSTLIPSLPAQIPHKSIINVENEDEENIRYQNGLQNGFVYFNGFAINRWIMIYLVKVPLSPKFIDTNLTILLDSAKRKGIPLGMPCTLCEFVLETTGNGHGLAQATKNKVIKALTTSFHKDLAMAMIYAPRNICLKELKAEITPLSSFPIITGCFFDRCGMSDLLGDLLSFVRMHKKLPVMGIASKLHDGHLIMACSLNKPRTGAKFDRLGWQSTKLAVFPVKQLHEQIMSVVLEYIQHKALDELVIYRSDASVSGWSVPYDLEARCIQKALKTARTRLTYVVVKELVVGQPYFEKIFDNIGFTDGEMTQLFAEVSFNSEKKGIPTPLAIAQMFITRMVDHYNGFKKNENYCQVAQVKQGLDRMACNVVKAFMKSSVNCDVVAHSTVSDFADNEEDEEDEKIRNGTKAKKKSKAKASSERKFQMKQGLGQKANQVVKVSTKSSLKKVKHQTEPLLKNK